MIRAVLFDFDDTLVDFRPTSARALFDAGAARVYACLTTLDCSLPSYDEFCRRQRSLARRIAFKRRLTFAKPDGRALLRRICQDYRLQRDEPSLARLGWLWYEPVVETASLAADVIPTLNALARADMKMGLIVNTIHQGAVIDRHLASLGLLDFFRVRVYSTEHALRKPHPGIFKIALAELGASAKETVLVGNDFATDIVGARRMGMTTVLRSERPSPREFKSSHHVIQRIGQLTELFELVSDRPAAMALPPLRAVG